jgi:hypothetical protein
VTIGAGVDNDSVFPVGGTTAGLAPPTQIISTASNPKKTTDFLFGVSRVLSRQWMMSVTGSKAFETGNLTEPYKLLSVLNSVGTPVSQLTEKRPDTRDRSSVLLSSVYHLTNDVFYSSYRYYWDTWDIKSHTLDLKYRHELDGGNYIEPLIRLYSQSAASFYTGALIQGHPLPDFASSDYRLGTLQTLTLGATYGFRLEDYPGDWSVRAQFVRQAGDSSPPNAIGIQRRFDLAPPVNIFALVIGYSFGY